MTPTTIPPNAPTVGPIEYDGIDYELVYTEHGDPYGEGGASVIVHGYMADGRPIPDDDVPEHVADALYHLLTYPSSD